MIIIHISAKPCLQIQSKMDCPKSRFNKNVFIKKIHASPIRNLQRAQSWQTVLVSALAYVGDDNDVLHWLSVLAFGTGAVLAYVGHDYNF